MTRAGKSHPLRVTFLTLFAAWITIWNALRLGSGLFFGKTLGEYHAFPVYVVTSGAIWMVMGAILTWGIWQGKSWAWLTTILATISYTGWFWSDRLLQEPQNINWPFSLAASFLILIVVGVILFTRRTREYFRKEPHER
jgi:hypothetical protein